MRSKAVENGESSTTEDNSCRQKCRLTKLKTITNRINSAPHGEAKSSTLDLARGLANSSDNEVKAATEREKLAAVILTSSGETSLSKLAAGDHQPRPTAWHHSKADFDLEPNTESERGCAKAKLFLLEQRVTSCERDLRISQQLNKMLEGKMADVKSSLLERRTQASKLLTDSIDLIKQLTADG